MNPVPDPILLEKFLGYSRESNPGPLRWQSDVLSTNINIIKQLFQNYEFKWVKVSTILKKKF